MNKTIRYYCNHCGRDFDAEDREFVECPGCFWSTSVRPAATEGTKSGSEPVHEKPAVSFAASEPARNAGLKPARLVPVLIALLLAAAAGMWFWGQNRETPADRIRISAASVTQEEEEMAHEAVSADLMERLQQPFGNWQPDPEKVRSVIAEDTSLKTGQEQRLPSAAWTAGNFREMLEEQQAFYQISFPRSYRGELEELFEKTYLPAAAAFREGRLLEARNLWVVSLAIPRYSEDISKHRGVALTMLRPFISDTLSKIGALNQMLVETGMRSREAEINALYASLRSQMREGNWQEAQSLLERLQARLEAGLLPQSLESAAPPYPPAVASVDADIRAALADLASVPNPAVSDLEPMKRDLLRKEQIIRMQMPEEIGRQKQFYQNAMRDIAAGRWEKAENELRKITFPPELVKHVDEKINMLRKLQNQKLDSLSESR